LAHRPKGRLFKLFSKEMTVKFSKTLLLPVAALVIVGVFWAVMTFLKRPSPIAPNAGAATNPPVASGGGASQAGTPRGASSSSLPGTSPGSIQNAPTAPVEQAANWWGAKLRARTVQVDEDEPPAQAAEVTEIKAGSPAAVAGLRVGDAIVGLSRQPVVGVPQLEDAVAATTSGGRLTLQVFRSGEPVELTITRGATGSGGGLAQAGQTESPLPTAGGTNPQGRTGIYINGREISQQQAEQLRAMYGYVAPPGKYWYDSRGGLYGTMGFEAAGFMRPGHDFGPLPANASNGNTGVFINGRQINMNEAMYCQRLFGAVYQGHWWLDGRTGNMGAEGNPMAIVNVFVALQQSQRSGQGGSYSWHSNTTGASGGSSGGCSYVSIPGSGTVSSGNCD
jgi:hypothetical protein